MQNCKYIIPHAKLQLHNISVFLYHVDTKLTFKKKCTRVRSTKNSTRRWTSYFDGLLPFNYNNM